MRKASWVVGLLLVVSLCGCTAGPSYLFRTVDDMQNTNYETDPLVTGILSSVVPIYEIGKGLGWLVDVVVLNPIQFWGWDVWDKQGAAFVHDNPAGVQQTWFPHFFEDDEEMTEGG